MAASRLYGLLYICAQITAVSVPLVFHIDQSYKFSSGCHHSPWLIAAEVNPHTHTHTHTDRRDFSAVAAARRGHAVNHVDTSAAAAAKLRERRM